jgi:hypothetical protein
MGSWSEICLICGLIPGGGPKSLWCEMDECLDDIIAALRKQEIESGLNEDQLRGEIREVLLLFEQEGGSRLNPTKYEKAVLNGSISCGSYFPFTSEDWDGWAAIAIGTFDQDGEPLITVKEGGILIPPSGFVSQTPVFAVYSNSIIGSHNTPGSR